MAACGAPPIARAAPGGARGARRDAPGRGGHFPPRNSAFRGRFFAPRRALRVRNGGLRLHSPRCRAYAKECVKRGPQSTRRPDDVLHPSRAPRERPGRSLDSLRSRDALFPAEKSTPRGDFSVHMSTHIPERRSPTSRTHILHTGARAKKHCVNRVLQSSLGRAVVTSDPKSALADPLRPSDALRVPNGVTGGLRMV